MVEKRGCHELVYLRKTRIAMSEQANFAGSLPSDGDGCLQACFRICVNSGPDPFRRAVEQASQTVGQYHTTRPSSFMGCLEMLFQEPGSGAPLGSPAPASPAFRLRASATA